jgi:hypothetical protein
LGLKLLDSGRYLNLWPKDIQELEWEEESDQYGDDRTFTATVFDDGEPMVSIIVSVYPENPSSVEYQVHDGCQLLSSSLQFEFLRV